MKKNSNLNLAKTNKNDEFYTQFEDINLEVDNYRDHFNGKVVYLNCDSKRSEFYRYFKIRFKFLNLKLLYATHFDSSGKAYKLEYDGEVETQTDLTGDGDFRSPESLEILVQSDVVVTNPPFSLFRDFLSLMVSFDKKFLLIGSMSAITYKEIFPLIRDNKLWLGINPVKKFLQPDGSFKSFGNICWFTNLLHKKRNEEAILFREFSEENYTKYDNYDAIEVGKLSEIPKDYDGVMGVPITFLMKYNPDQFYIIGSNRGVDQDKNKIYGKGSYIGGKETFKRIFIKLKKDVS